MPKPDPSTPSGQQTPASNDPPAQQKPPAPAAGQGTPAKPKPAQPDGGDGGDGGGGQDSGNAPAKEIPAAKPPEGTVAGEFDNEIQVLAYQSLLKVADAIAARVHAHGKNRTVVLADRALARFLMLRDQFLGAVALLRKLLEGLKAEAEAEAKKKEAAKVPTVEALAAAAAAMVNPIAAVTTALDAAALLVSYFKVDITVKKGDVTVDADTLRIAIAGALLKHKVKVLWPGLSAKQGGADGLFDKLLGLEALNQELQAMTMSDALKARLAPLSLIVGTLIGRVFEAGKPEPGDLLHRLAAADAVAKALDDKTWLLVADLVKSGGSSLIRKSLWTNICGGNPVKFSGMAIVSYEVIDPKTGELADCGVLYSHIPHTTFAEDDSDQPVSTNNLG